MTSSSRPNLKLTEIDEYITGTFKGGSDAVNHFVTLINCLLRWTVTDSSQFVMAHRGPHQHRIVIAPPKRNLDKMSEAAKGNEIYSPILLNDCRYLAVEYDVFIDVAKDDFLKVVRSLYVVARKF